jgi:dihydrofolate reductase
MRKVILDLAVTLDGFIEGIKGEIDWCIMEDDMDFNGFLMSIDSIFTAERVMTPGATFNPTAMQV